jgi:hypothetical protein
MFGAVPTLDPMDIEVPGFEIHPVPPQRDEFGRAEPVAKHQQDDRRIAHGMPAGFACRLDHGLHVLRSEIVAYGGAPFLGGAGRHSADNFAEKERGPCGRGMGKLLTMLVSRLSIFAETETIDGLNPVP